MFISFQIIAPCVLVQKMQE